MTATDLLKEVLKDPMLKDKYNLSDEDILSVSFDRTSNHQIIEVLKTIVLLKTQNQSDVNVYKQIKAINFALSDSNFNGVESALIVVLVSASYT